MAYLSFSLLCLTTPALGTLDLSKFATIRCCHTRPYLLSAELSVEQCLVTQALLTAVTLTANQNWILGASARLAFYLNISGQLAY